VSASKRPKARPYPYQIPPVTLPHDEIVRHLNGGYVAEFLRNEALLRSPAVHLLYRQKADDSTLFGMFGISWHVLKGSHHEWLMLPEKSFTHLTPEWYREKDEQAKRLRNDGFSISPPRFPRYLEENLIISISPDAPPERVLADLRPFLKAHYAKKQNLRPQTSFKVKLQIHYPDPDSPSKKSITMPGGPGFKLIKNLKAWLDYFRCYDLRQFHSDWSFGQIGQKVWPSEPVNKSRERAEKAILRATRMISAAERNEWPPTSRFLFGASTKP